MLLLAIVAITTLAANSARQLRYMAIAFFGVALAAHLIDDGSLAAAQVVVSACAALVASAILFVAARDRRYGEDPGWRLWIATVVAAVVLHPFESSIAETWNGPKNDFLTASSTSSPAPTLEPPTHTARLGSPGARVK